MGPASAAVPPGSATASRSSISPSSASGPGIDQALARALEEYGLLSPRVEGGERLYREGDADIAAACGRLAQFGIDARHLRTFRNSAGREASLLEQLVAPALRARNPERRKAGLDDLQALAEAAQELSQLLFWRAVPAGGQVARWDAGLGPRSGPFRVFARGASASADAPPARAG